MKIYFNMLFGLMSNDFLDDYTLLETDEALVSAMLWNV